DPADPASLSDDYVTSILQDRDGALWVGTRSAGLNRIDTETRTVTRYVPDRDDEDSLSHHSVSSIYEDSTGNLWVGTGGGGLNRLRDDRVSFERFTEADGLLDDDVMGIVEDARGSLWVSTKRGLARLDPHVRAFSNLVVADGLPSGEFEPGAVTRDRNTLYFGSVKGLVAVPSSIPFPEPTPSPTVITGIRTAQGKLPIDRPVWELDRLEIPWGKWLSMEFAVLDFSTEHRHGFAYRLGDSDAEWVELESRREITFTDLDPGIHELAIRGRNHLGVWSMANPTLHIEVIPPFWMTWWFRSLMLLVVVGVVVTAHRVRVNAVKRRNLELIRLHDQREKARDELARTYDRLRHLTRRVEAAKEEERRHIARELHDELGPALTAVIINLHLVRKNPAEADERVTDTIALADRLVDQVRDLSLDLRPPLLDELGLVPALRAYIETEAKRAGISIDVVEDGPVKPLPAEVEITAFRLVQEAVTNVIRHAEANKVSVRVRGDNGQLVLSVADDGKGFDVDRTLAGPAGDALGLFGMHERVQNLGGELNIESSPGSGTVIRGRMSMRGNS
ncbi:MAG: histidine kinase, partial [Acidobacteriota bacterium]|nr:histidine kinase [Acidobacteriota bacterium]